MVASACHNMFAFVEKRREGRRCSLSTRFSTKDSGSVEVRQGYDRRGHQCFLQLIKRSLLL